MSMFTPEQLAQIGFEPGTVYALVSEVSIQQLLDAQRGSIVLKPPGFQPPKDAKQISVEVALSDAELIEEIDPDGSCGTRWRLTAPARPINPRAAWIEGVVVGISAGMTDSPAGLSPSAKVLILVDFDQPAGRRSTSLRIWLQLVHPIAEDTKAPPQIGTAEELLALLKP